MTANEVSIPAEAWQTEEVRAALVNRDIGAIFRAAQRYAGLSQARIASATGLSQARVNEVINGRREVTNFGVVERIADGLQIPDASRRALGLAPRTYGERGPDDLAAYPEVVDVYRDQASAQREISEHLIKATRVDVLAIRGLGLLGLNDSLLRSHLASDHGAAVRIFLLDPDGTAAASRATELGDDPAGYAAGIRMTLGRLAGLPGLQVYLYDQVPVWRVIRLDTVMFVSTFGTWEGHESAMYKLIETPRGPLFQGIARHIDTLTLAGRPAEAVQA